MSRTGFVPPPYPFDLLGDLAAAASSHPGGMVDLSVGTPCDPPSAAVLEALAHSGAERGYPPAVGSDELRAAAAAWMHRRFGVGVDWRREVAACIGTKEFVAGTPHLLHLRRPERDTVFYPSLAYPSYEMGALLAGCRPVRVGLADDGTLDLDSISPEDAARGLCLWVNSPGNPAGQLEHLDRCAEWGRRHDVPVLSDECYVEFTWEGPPRSILEHGSEGVVAVHSLSKRSNVAGVRAGVYAGDAEIVGYLAAVRRHAGFMVPGPVQHAAAVAFDDDEGASLQKKVYEERLLFLAAALSHAGVEASMPSGAFYLWVRCPPALRRSEETAGESLASFLADRAGVLASPGVAYGPDGADFVRLAAVQPLDRLELVASRLAAAAAV